MKFGSIDLNCSKGHLLAHTHRCGDDVIRKGTLLLEEHILLLKKWGHTEIVVAQLEEGDVREDIAARAIAAAICGEGLVCSKPIAGRCNIRAAAHGLLCYSPTILEELGCIDWRVTVGARIPYAHVRKDQVVATVKIIPYAIPFDLLNRVQREGMKCFSLQAFVSKNVALLISAHKEGSDRRETRSIATQKERLERLGSSLDWVEYCSHHEDSIAKGLRGLLDGNWDVILFLGASAVVDEEDVFPCALRGVGGEVIHIGMPVDPGNMLVLGKRATTMVIGLPGCARSAKPSEAAVPFSPAMANLESSSCRKAEPSDTPLHWHHHWLQPPLRPWS